MRGAPAGRRVRGGPRSTNPTQPPFSQPDGCQLPSRGAFYSAQPLLLVAYIKIVRRGRRCGVAQRSMPQWGIEPHERASFAGWRRSLCAAKRRRPGQPCAATKPRGRIWNPPLRNQHIMLVQFYFTPVGEHSICSRAISRSRKKPRAHTVRPYINRMIARRGRRPRRPVQF